MWNKTAKLLQDLYYKEFNRILDPFNDIGLKSVRYARYTKRFRKNYRNARNATEY